MECGLNLYKFNFKSMKQKIVNPFYDDHQRINQMINDIKYSFSNNETTRIKTKKLKWMIERHFYLEENRSHFRDIFRHRHNNSATDYYLNRSSDKNPECSACRLVQVSGIGAVAGFRNVLRCDNRNRFLR